MKSNARGKQGSMSIPVSNSQSLKNVPTKSEDGEKYVLSDGKTIKQLAIITWEDITAYVRVEIPENFDKYRLLKKTVGLIWVEAEEYLVLVQDYDMTNKGKGFRHNDFHIIPKGVIKEIRYLGKECV